MSVWFWSRAAPVATGSCGPPRFVVVAWFWLGQTVTIPAPSRASPRKGRPATDPPSCRSSASSSAHEHLSVPLCHLSNLLAVPVPLTGHHSTPRLRRANVPSANRLRSTPLRLSPRHARRLRSFRKPPRLPAAPDESTSLASSRQAPVSGLFRFGVAQKQRDRYLTLPLFPFQALRKQIGSYAPDYLVAGAKDYPHPHLASRVGFSMLP